MAGELELTVHAIKFHLAAVYRKLGVSNRTEAAVAYLRAGDDA
jgi:DNA-binding NarL/FixJ family response regulator